MNTLLLRRSTFLKAIALASVMLAVITLPSRVATAADTIDAWRAGEMFENVVTVLRTRFYDRRIREDVVPELAQQFREQAHKAASLADEREIVEQMLAHIPASHLGLLSVTSHQQMMRNLAGEKAPTFGMELALIEDKYFVQGVLEGGAADEAGVKRGDCVMRIDGVYPARSSRLDWRTDDAALIDPPQHALLCRDGDRIVLEIERTPGETLEIEVVAREDSALEATKRSARVITANERSIAYIHLWYMHHDGVDDLLSRLFRNEFKQADALVLDLRGRGGNASMVMRVLRTLAGKRSKWNRPIVALIDANTRSAKEMLAFELKSRGLGVLVGETTAGALLPATFAQVGGESVLMYPAFALGKYSEAIEGKGVEPDVHFEAPGPYCAGADAILEAGVKKAAELAVERELKLKTQPVM